MAQRGDGARDDRAIAVVGMSCRLPGAGGIEQLWSVLTEGRETLGELPDDRFGRPVPVDPERGPGSIVTRRGGFLDDIDRFDAGFFGISPREAQVMDPQQRLLLEVAYEALEDAGWALDDVAGTRTGVYVGQWTHDYFDRINDATDALDLYATTGGGRYAASGRLSFAFDLRGPALTIDTACSSSLAAVHLACQALRAGSCTAAVVGGVNLILDPAISIAYSRSRILSADGRCKFGDASADGYVRSEGVGVVVLKPLARALADGDRVRAVVLGTAANSDGRASGLLVAPGRDSQIEMLEAAYADAGIEPAEVTYMEAHGTGTRAGDPAELSALAAVLGRGRASGAPCHIGSIKTNIGHCEAASGIAGFIKAALCIERGALPPTLNLRTPSSRIPWATLPFRMQTAHTPWPAGRPRIAAVNSFGITGANAHAILAAPPPAPSRIAPADGAHVFALSAASPAALRGAVDRALEHLEALDGAAPLADLCWTAARRTRLPHRMAVAAETAHGLIDGLRARRATPGSSAIEPATEPSNAAPRVAFVCCGQGPQRADMGRALLASEPVFATALETIDAAFRPLAGWSIRAVLDGSDPRDPADTAVAQPCLFALHVGLARLLESWGVTAEAIVGHSIGEVAAAHLAGALDVRAATRLVYHRSRLMQAATALGGAMAAVELSHAEAAALLAEHPQVDVAAENGPRARVIAGPRDAVQAVVAAVEARDRFARLLDVNYAFHSAQMAPHAAALADVMHDLHRAPERLDFYSSVAGARLPGARLSPAYWAANVREPVRFRHAIDAMLADGIDTFVELSPRAVLRRHIEDTAADAGLPVTTVGTLDPRVAEAVALRATAARLFERGLDVDLRALQAPGRHTRLPSYAWDRQRHWFPWNDGARRGPMASAGHPIIDGGHELAGSDDRIWHGTAGAGTASAWLLDHRVEETAIMPGAAYVDLMLTAARARVGDRAIELRDVTFREAMLLPAIEAVPVQVTLTPDGRLRVFGRAEPGRWTLHAEASAAPMASAPAPMADAAPEPAPGMQTLERDACYAACARAGLHYGPCFRSIERITAHAGQARATIRLAEPLRGDPRGHAVHPALLDACLQAYVAALDSRGLNPDGATYVPLQIDTLVCHRPAPARVVAHVRLDPSATADAAEHRVDIDVTAPDGEPVLTLRGLCITRLPAGALARLAEVRIDDWLHAIEWVPRPLPSTAAIAPGWLVLDDESGVADRLCDAIDTMGGHAIRCVPGPTLETDGDRWQFDPLDPAHAEAFVAALPSLEAWRIVDLWPLRAGAAGSDALDADLALACAAPLHLLRALAGGAGRGARLWIVSRGAMAVSGPCVAPVAAAAWGLGRVAAHELPDVWGGLIDLDPHDPPDARRILDAIEAGDGEDQVGLSSTAYRVARLTAHRATAEPVAIRGDRSYVISGGLGDLGRFTARWLLDRGARHLVLLGRSAPTETARAELSEMAARADVRVVQADVTDGAALRATLAAATTDMPPIAGLVHGAGVLHDGSLAQMRWTDARAVMRPKIDGLLALLDAVDGAPLELVLAYSSVSGWLGQAGQGNYAAANGFMDAIASMAPAARTLSVAWGLWDGLGMARDLDDRARARWAADGHDPVTPARARLVLDRLLRTPSGAVGAFHVDWRRSPGRSPLLEGMRHAAQPAESDRGPATVDAPTRRPSVIGRASGRWSPVRSARSSASIRRACLPDSPSASRASTR